MKFSKSFILMMGLFFIFGLFSIGCNSENSGNNSNDVGSDISEESGSDSDGIGDDGDGNIDGDSNDGTNGQGQLTLNMTDAASDDYQAVYVTISEVQVQRADLSDPCNTDEDCESDWDSDFDENNPTEDGKWITLSTEKATYNLLDLVNGIKVELSSTSLGVDAYSQIRLIIAAEPDDSLNIFGEAHPFGNYVVDLDDVVHELKIPGGTQSGIKIENEFDILANGTTELLLDFDASKSIVVAGNSGNYLLKPTIKVLNVIEDATLTGTVTAEADGAVLAGALVSVQIYDVNATDPKDQVIVITSTITDENGRYTLFLEPGTYNIVVTKFGYQELSRRVTLEIDEVLEENFSLVAKETGSVMGVISLTDLLSEKFGTVSIRFDADLDGSVEKVEVSSVNVQNGGTYSVDLPVGDYDVVCFSEDESTLIGTIHIEPNMTAEFDFYFGNSSGI